MHEYPIGEVFVHIFYLEVIDLLNTYRAIAYAFDTTAHNLLRKSAACYICSIGIPSRTTRISL